MTDVEGRVANLNLGYGDVVLDLSVLLGGKGQGTPTINKSYFTPCSGISK